MIRRILGVLLVAGVLGFALTILGGFLHLLIGIAVVVGLVRLIQGKSPV